MPAEHLYRGMDRAALDAAYNNSAAVSDSAAIIAAWDRRSAAFAATHAQYLDLRYGPRERNRIDYFPATSRRGPVLVFIHGGYWQMRAKETFRFVAQGPLAQGIDVALIGYTLAPDARLTDIVAETHAALTWLAGNLTDLGGDAQRLFVSGWSAGGHLTAMSLGHPAVRGGLAISGIYDLEPIRLSYLDEKLRLTAEEIERLSPQRSMTTITRPLAIAYGTAELPELQRQSCDYAAALARTGADVTLAALPGHHHFSVMEELADPNGKLATLAVKLCAS